jgi:hypothetical protein
VYQLGVAINKKTRRLAGFFVNCISYEFEPERGFDAAGMATPRRRAPERQSGQDYNDVPRRAEAKAEAIP